MNPYGSISKYCRDISSGSKLATTREPSKGGMGIRLNTPNIKFMRIRWLKMKTRTSGKGMSLNNRLNRKANMILERGPPGD
jgi:hypothetical protein